MGNCLQNKSGFEIKYEKTVSLCNKHLMVEEKVVFRVTEPVIEREETLEVGRFRLKFSLAAVPGQDPRDDSLKVCQDFVFLAYKTDAILLTVFDGHGVNGHEVVKFCENFIKNFFTSEEIQNSSVAEYLCEMFSECDKQLGISEINTQSSGTTCTSLLFTPEGLYVASVGDSRAILSSIPRILSKSITPFKIAGKDLLPNRLLQIEQLSIDHRPNLELELKRIKEKGGIVHRTTNPDGTSSGPYRVFKPNKNSPGLSMSRSLGDKSAKQLGVICKPTLEFYPLLVFRDLFIVVATDGLWEVMENDEVSCFVEEIRSKCLNTNVNQEFVAVSNSTVSRMLCEEARFRWIEGFKEKGLMIDDITVGVVQISTTELGEVRQGESCQSSLSLGDVVDLERSGVGSMRSTVTCYEDAVGEEIETKIN